MKMKRILVMNSNLAYVIYIFAIPDAILSTQINIRRKIL